MFEYYALGVGRDRPAAFGHSRLERIMRLPRRQFLHLAAGALAAIVSPDGNDHRPGQPDNDRADYLCPICLANAAVAMMLGSKPRAKLALG